MTWVLHSFNCALSGARKLDFDFLFRTTRVLLKAVLELRKSTIPEPKARPGIVKLNLLWQEIATPVTLKSVCTCWCLWSCFVVTSRSLSEILVHVNSKRVISADVESISIFSEMIGNGMTILCKIWFNLVNLPCAVQQQAEEMIAKNRLNIVHWK